MTATIQQSTISTKAVVAASVGNFVEWFEFTAYGFFASSIAATFFPTDGVSSLLATFATFAVSFVVRPLGALVFGHLGDRLGRRGTLSAAVLGMSVATFAIGLLPGYHTAGLLGPVLLVIARIVQGFSAGGEFGGATAFLVEYAPPGRRMFAGSWQFATQCLAGFAGAASGAVLSAVLTPQDLADWGWRLPFLAMLPLGLIGLYLRLRLAETPEFHAADHDEKAPLLEALRYWRTVLTVIGMIVAGTTMTYMVEGFLPAFLVRDLRVPPAQMYTGMLVGLGTQGVLTPLWGLLADRVGRCRPFLIASPLALVVLAVPAYELLLERTLPSTLLAYVLTAAAASPNTGVLATAMADAFPARVRYSGLSLAYSVSVSIFGGFTPLLLTGLIDATGSRLAPGWYLTAAAAVTLVAALVFPEPARSPAR